MFSPSRYRAWTIRRYGKVAFDLATSGIPSVAESELNVAPHAESLLPAAKAYTSLVEAIAHYNDCSTAEVVPALGTSHGVFLAYAAMLAPGDDVLVETPVYDPLTIVAEGLGARVRTFERRAEEGFAIVPERVAASIGPRTRAIVVSTLHNPSGVRAPDATLRELAKIAEARGAWLVVDEVYAPFDALPEDGVFRSSARKLGANVIAISSLTKCYGLGFHRVGWVLGPPAIALGAEAAMISTVGLFPVAHARTGLAAFANLGSFATRAMSLAKGKREIAEQWVSTVPGATWSKPTEGLFGLVTLDRKGDLLPAIDRTADEKGILVAAGSFFGAPNAFRLSWASLDRPKFEEALTRLSSAMSTW